VMFGSLVHIAGSGAIGTAVGRVVMCGRSASQSAVCPFLHGAVRERATLRTPDVGWRVREIGARQEAARAGPAWLDRVPLRSSGRPTQRHTVEICRKRMLVTG
jgi:hypothetical protein